MANTSVIVLLSGDVDGVNRTFTTPGEYEAGTLRLVFNGQVYESNDERKGWTETSGNTIQLLFPPIEGDVLQAFYVDKTTGIVGSPFDPNGLYP